MKYTIMMHFIWVSLFAKVLGKGYPNTKGSGWYFRAFMGKLTLESRENFTVLYICVIGLTTGIFEHVG